MSTQVQRRQQFIRYYKLQTGSKDVNMHDVAVLAHKMGQTLPKPADPMDLLAKQFSEAARQETRIDKETNRPYKANLAITRRLPDGRQDAFYFDVDDNAPRHKMVKGLHLYREQMLGEAVIGCNTAEHWSRINPKQEPLPFETDFTDEVKWRRNSSGDVADVG